VGFIENLQKFIRNRGKKPEEAIGTSEPAVNLKTQLPTQPIEATAPEKDRLAQQGTVVTGGTPSTDIPKIDPQVAIDTNIALEQPELTVPQGVKQITLEDQFGNFDGVRFEVPVKGGETEIFTMDANQYKDYVEAKSLGFETNLPGSSMSAEQAETLRKSRAQFQLDFAEREQQLKQQEVFDKFIDQYAGLREELNYTGGEFTYEQAKALIEIEFAEGISVASSLSSAGKSIGVLALLTPVGKAAAAASNTVRVAAGLFLANDLLAGFAENKKEAVGLADGVRVNAEKEFPKIRELANAGGDPVDVVRAFNRQVELMKAAYVVMSKQMEGKSATEQAQGTKELYELKKMLDDYVPLERQLLYNAIQNPAPTRPLVGGAPVSALTVEQDRLLRESGL